MATECRLCLVLAAVCSVSLLRGAVDWSVASAACDCCIS